MILDKDGKEHRLRIGFLGGLISTRETKVGQSLVDLVSANEIQVDRSEQIDEESTTDGK